MTPPSVHIHNINNFFVLYFNARSLLPKQNLNIGRGYYLRAATISFSSAGSAA